MIKKGSPYKAAGRGSWPSFIPRHSPAHQSRRSRRFEMPRLRARERLDAVRRQREPHPRMADAGPGEPRAHPIATVPVDAARAQLPEDLLRAFRVLRVDPGGEAVFGVVHQIDSRRIVGDALDPDDRAEAL